MINLRFTGHGYSRGGSPAGQFSCLRASRKRFISRREGYVTTALLSELSRPHMRTFLVPSTNTSATAVNQAHRLFRLLRGRFLPPSAMSAALVFSLGGQFSGARFSSRQSFIRRRDGYGNAGLLLGALQPLSRRQPRHSPCGISSLRTGRFELPCRDQAGAAA